LPQPRQRPHDLNNKQDQGSKADRIAKTVGATAVFWAAKQLHLTSHKMRLFFSSTSSTDGFPALKLALKQATPAFRLISVVIPTVLLLWFAVTAGCSRSSGPQTQVGNSKPKIVTTTGMIRDMVQTLVGPDAEVTAIMGPGVDPHLYQPSRGDSVKLLEADIVVYNGLHLEGRLGEVLETRSDSDAASIAVGETLDEEKLLDADAGLHDPHIWMNVSLWRDAAINVASALADLMPDHADSILERATQLDIELDELDQWGEVTIESIPESQRVLVTAHDAFQYFGKRYGVEVYGVQGVSTISDAAISDVNRLVDLIVDRKVPAVFFESSVSPRQVKAIVEGAQQRGLDVSSDSTLLSDSMGADGTPEGTYVGMMRHNFETIALALGGQITEPGAAAENQDDEAATTINEETDTGETDTGETDTGDTDPVGQAVDGDVN
jgi:manganese/zinc/iron transport system substrate-binding protein